MSIQTQEIGSASLDAEAQALAVHLAELLRGEEDASIEDRLAKALTQPKSRAAIQALDEETTAFLLNDVLNMATDSPNAMPYLAALMKAGVDFKKPFEFGRTPLMVLLQNASAGRAWTILDRSDPYAVSDAGRTALSEACKLSTPRVEMIKALIPPSGHPLRQAFEFRPGAEDEATNLISPLVSLMRGSRSAEIAKLIVPFSDVFEEAQFDSLAGQVIGQTGVRSCLEEAGMRGEGELTETLFKRAWAQDAERAKKIGVKIVDALLEYMDKMEAFAKKGGSENQLRNTLAPRMKTLEMLCGLEAVSDKGLEKVLGWRAKLEIEMPRAMAVRERRELARTVEQARAGAEKSPLAPTTTIARRI